MQSKKIMIEGVGEILLERSVRARYVNLSVRPFKGVRVAVPAGVSFSRAAQVACSKAEWLKAMLQRTACVEKQATNLRLQPPLDRQQARRMLVGRLYFLAGKHGFQFNKVFTRSQRTRWGSCSRLNNINLNINLARLPAELIDYTILHELVHTRIKNHSIAFWKEMARYMTDPRVVDKELDKYWPLLMDVVF